MAFKMFLSYVYTQIMTSATPEGSSGVPIYVWAIIGVVGGGILLAVVLSLAIIFVLQKRKKKDITLT